MTIIINHNYYHDKGEAGCPSRLEDMLGNILETMETLLMSAEELKADIAETKVLIGNVKGDVEGLMAKLDAFVATGMTADQVAEVRAELKAVNDSLRGVDALNPAPEAPPAEPTA